jgi:hypothetical protein
MLIYDDRVREDRLARLVQAGRRALAGAPQPSLDELRNLLILAGQIEQAVADKFENTLEHRSEGPDAAERGDLKAGDAAKLSGLATQLTDESAATFFAGWASAQRKEGAHGSLANMRAILDALQAYGEERVSVTRPEGFAFYSLFPEQYCAAAQKWSAAHAEKIGARVLVVGIRSIGTTLSAVVRATLRACGSEAERLTVRPTGPPFERVVKAAMPATGATALVVDEGPGISGSSMAAAAEWLSKAGVSKIAFLPGHPNGPGSSASERTREWWSKTPAFHVGLSELTWGPATLREHLADASTHWCGAVKEVHDLSAGAWRSWAFKQQSEWPAVCKGFERTKFLCVGERASVLWKFSGLGSSAEGCTNEERQAEERRRKLMTFIPVPVAERSGFLASPWVEGKRLTAKDGQDHSVLQHIANYIAVVAGPALTEQEARKGFARLTRMLLCNTREALGEEWEQCASGLSDSMSTSAGTLSYGDGRLAPHEWVRAADGKILKTDSFGHDQDHTLIGKQSVLWDIAGAIVEWELSGTQAELLSQVLSDCGVPVESPTLPFYTAAYLAFRIGFISFGMGQAGNELEERRRLSKELERYKVKLKARIKA